MNFLKKTLFILIILITILNCSLDPEKEYIYIEKEVYVEIPVEIENKEYFSNIINTYNRVKNIISYKKDIDVWGVSDYWQSPEITLELKTGDCEDFSILFMYYLQEYNPTLEIIETIPYVTTTRHAVVNIDDYIYDLNYNVIMKKVNFYENDKNRFLYSIDYNRTLDRCNY